MEKTVHLYITLNNDYQTVKNIVSGTIHLKTLDILNLERITLTVTKSYSAKITSSYNQISDDKTVYEYCFDVYKAISEYTRLSTGHHTYPFQFYLKARDGASTKMESTFGSEIYKISNEYKLSAKIKIYGIYMPLITTQKELFVIDESRINRLKAVDIKMSYCLCLVNEKIKLTSEFDKKCYFSGDKANLKLCCDKDTIVAVNWYLYQLASVTVNSTFKTKSRLVNYGENKGSANSITCEIPLFSNLPSTVLEDKFEIRYLFQIVVQFKGKAVIRYTQDVFIAQRCVKESDDVFFDVLKGINGMTQFFLLE